MITESVRELGKKPVNMWNFLPEHVVNAPSVDSFNNRLDKQWSNGEILYDYKAATPAGHKPFAPAGTQYLTIEAKACVNLSKPK